MMYSYSAKFIIIRSPLYIKQFRSSCLLVCNLQSCCHIPQAHPIFKAHISDSQILSIKRKTQGSYSSLVLSNSESLQRFIIRIIYFPYTNLRIDSYLTSCNDITLRRDCNSSNIVIMPSIYLLIPSPEVLLSIITHILHNSKRCSNKHNIVWLIGVEKILSTIKTTIPIHIFNLQ